MGSLGQDSVWVGKFWGFLDILPRARLDIVDQMWVKFRMGLMGASLYFWMDTFWENTYFWKLATLDILCLTNTMGALHTCQFRGTTI